MSCTVDFNGGSSPADSGTDSGQPVDARPWDGSQDCGNGILQADEECDDGNPQAGDGCSGSCAIESGWTCAGVPSLCAPVCGDGMAVGDEPCDGSDLNGRTCADLGYAGGQLSCSSSCVLDAGACVDGPDWRCSRPVHIDHTGSTTDLSEYQVVLKIAFEIS